MTDPSATPPGEGRDAGRPDDGPTADAPADRPVSRRDLLRSAGLGGVAALGAGWLAHELIPHGHGGGHAAPSGGVAARGLDQGEAYRPPLVGGAGGEATLAAHESHGYGHATAPPPGLGADALDGVTVPPPFDGRQGVTRDHDLSVTERQLAVGDGVVVDAWTYGGTVPGPIVRATVGDTVRLHMANRTRHAHNVHLHGRHQPAMDGWEPIPPGSEFTYEVEASPVGVHPYHCHVAPLAEHLGRGLYGTMIVDPPGGRPPAHEFVLVLGGWDLDGDGVNELVCWNGVAGWFHTYPLRVPVGEPVRCYVVNMLEHEPLASFHLHAETFDVFRTGTSLEPDEHTDTVTLSQGERAIVEFTLPERGRYMFHPHQSWLADRGAMGWFAAV